MRSVLTEIVLSMGFKVEKVKEEEKAILELKFKYIIFSKKTPEGHINENFICFPW